MQLRKRQEEARRQEIQRKEEAKAAAAAKAKAQEAEEQRLAELALAELERKKLEEKPAWGGAAKSKQETLTLKQIQEIEKREAEGKPQSKSGGNVSMAARIAQGGYSSVSTTNSSNNTNAGGNVNLGAQKDVASSPVVPISSAALPIKATTEIPVNAQGNTLNDMSVDLRAMLGVQTGRIQQQRLNSKASSQNKSAWGSVRSVVEEEHVDSGKSLKEIQEEEARRLLAREQQGKKKSSTGYAAKAGAQASWHYNPNTNTKISDSIPTPSTSTTTFNKKPLNTKDVFGNHTNKNDGSNTQETENNGSVSDNFGGQTMSNDMRRWCETQVRQLGATMTLIEFCYTLLDASDIREYLRDYLGSTPQVSSFATEFIRRKKSEGQSSSSNGANTSGFITAGGKKGKKGKKGKH